MNENWQQPWLHREGIINGVRLHWVEAGVKGSPLVILLHGFPEFWYSWRHQIPVLRREGYRVIAPDLRGYNLSEKPKSGFDSDTLTTDILELIKFAGETEARIVGHDCGAVIAWAFAARYPKHTKKLVILNAPPVQRLADYFDKSWFMFLLWLFPNFSEFVGGINRSWLISQSLKYFSKDTEWLDEQTMELYRGSISRRGSLHCMMEYYRNIWTSSKQCEQYNTTIRAPTLVLWGEFDNAFQTELCNSLGDFVSNKFTLVLLDSGHFIQEEIPQEVNRFLIQFLNQ